MIILTKAIIQVSGANVLEPDLKDNSHGSSGYIYIAAHTVRIH